MRGIGRVQNKGGRGGEGVGEVAWIEGGPMDEIGLAEKSPPETRGGEIANLDRGIKEVRVEVEGGIWRLVFLLGSDKQSQRTEQKLAFSVSILLLFSI